MFKPGGLSTGLPGNSKKKYIRVARINRAKCFLLGGSREVAPRFFIPLLPLPF
jgi:hypothetical protein